jgi:hypothetical protein
MQSTELSEQTPAQIDTALYPILEKIAKAEHTVRNYRRILDERAELPYIRKSHEETIAKAEEQIEQLNAEAAPFEAEFDRRGGWARYIISGQVAEASGMDEAEVVASFNATACTHCFPSAPVEHKPTIEELGLCEHSGQYVPEEFLPADWHRYAVLPTVKCECGWRGAITKSGKYRKHERGA